MNLIRNCWCKLRDWWQACAVCRQARGTRFHYRCREFVCPACYRDFVRDGEGGVRSDAS
jgi:hypothetical protein